MSGNSAKAAKGTVPGAADSVHLADTVLQQAVSKVKITAGWTAREPFTVWLPAAMRQPNAGARGNAYVHVWLGGSFEC